ncbi:MAG: efflux RND transporter permease subunit [Proteobacteria bacterium]|nr:efflux RND transporter permease subunit [Pseudomonadota bacterium]
MSLASTAIKRPVSLTALIILMLTVGYLSLKKLPVDLFPDVNFPIVTVTTVYPGAGPKEIETQVSKVIEDEVSGISGIKTVRSESREGASIVVVEFSLETDIKYAEQQVRDRVANAKRKVPDDVKEPVIRRISPSDQPIATLTLTADLSEDKLFDLADEVIRPRLEQVNQVGLVTVIGGRKREIHVNLDRNKLKEYELSASLVTQRLAATGQNVPVGKADQGAKEASLRAIGEFSSLSDIKSTVINFLGNDTSISLDKIATIEDALVDETNRTYLDGKKTLMFMIFKQSGSNTIEVTKGIKKQIDKIQTMIDGMPGKGQIKIVREASRMIEANVADVKESIFIGIALTVLVVFFFLGSGRSTLITGLALPNSLLGAFILMAFAGFTINIMSLLALSLAVGLLVDDAIVVRENIFRHRAMGKSAIAAAIEGTSEVSLAVIATTMTVIAVFGPIGFLQGMVGQFFKEFGLTICFAMAISLFDALTIAPMMSAYFGGSHHVVRKGIAKYTIQPLLDAFESFQQLLERGYASLLKASIRHPILTVLISFGVFAGSIYSAKFIPKTFMSAQDNGEFAVALDLPPGTSLERMNEVSLQVDSVIRARPEVAVSLLTVGNREGQSNKAEFYISLVSSKKRSINTTQAKELIRADLKEFKFANPVVKDIDGVGGGWRPFNVNIVGTDLDLIEKYSMQLFEKIKNHPALSDVDISHRPGKPETQFAIDRNKAQLLGVAPNMAGAELRNLVEGTTPAIFRQEGREFDIRVRLRPDQRDITKVFNEINVPNLNGRNIRLASVANKIETTTPANINRQDRGRYIQISADIAAKGPGLGGAMTDITNILENEIKLPEGMRYQFVGQAESFQELIVNMTVAVVLSVIFIYLVLASLYESFVTPFTIMLVLPLAVSGALYALLIMGVSLDLFAMIGCILLMGIATKNSILLVDYANQKVAEGMERNAAMIESGKTRLRPILMTSVALIAGMLPVAIGLNEASKQRTTMGIAVIGGLITSTLLSLVVVPACYAFIDRFRAWAAKKLGALFLTH